MKIKMKNNNQNKELIAVGASFIVIVGIAMYMFVSQQKHNIATLKTEELKGLVEKSNYKLDSLGEEINKLTQRLDETDAKYHQTGN